MEKIEDRIKKDIASSVLGNGVFLEDLKLIRVKEGIYLYRGTYKNRNTKQAAVVKFFENEGDRREIENYRLLMSQNIPTLKLYAVGKATVVIEDIDASNILRLGREDDLNDSAVAQALAAWYFSLHEKGSFLVNGAEIKAPHGYYCEFELVNKETIQKLLEHLPQGEETFKYLLSEGVLPKLSDVFGSFGLTLTYNDFYFTNFAVAKDKSSAMMFDYNLLGKGYRYGDFRNVCSSLSKPAGDMFVKAYEGLYFKKYGSLELLEKMLAEEKDFDDVVSTIFTLFSAYSKTAFPSWGEACKEEVLNGNLLSGVKKLIG